MKYIIDYFAKKGKVFKSLVKIENSKLKIRKKIEIFCGTDVNGNYHALYLLEQKSRFLLKDTQALLDIDQKVQDFMGHNFRYRHFLRSMQTCSKSKELLQRRGWKIHNDFM